MLDNKRLNHLYYHTQKARLFVMIIKLFDIEDIFTLKGDIEDFPSTSEYRLSSPLHYEFRLKRSKNKIKVRGLIDCIVILTCSRCLEEFGYLVSTTSDFDLLSQDSAPDIQELELKRDEMDIYYYEGSEVELEPLIHEEIMLNLPIKPLCSESCRGLCPICGTNQNYGQCSCKKDINTLLGEKLKHFIIQ